MNLTKTYKLNIEILHMTYQKVMMRLDGKLLVTIILRLSANSDVMKVILSPNIGSLNDFMAFKFHRGIQHWERDPQVSINIFSILLNELYHSYEAFQTVFDL